MTKKSNLSLYILDIENMPIIKIGLSEKLPKRINTFRNLYNIDFDLPKSFLVGCHNKSKIIALEKELKANTTEFKLKGKLKERFEGLNGATELRHSDCLPLILKLIKYKVNITGEFLFYEGISLEKNILAELPTAIYNNNGETEYIDTKISKKLINTIQNQYPTFNDLNEEEITNIILKDFIVNKKLKIVREKGTSYRRRKKTFSPWIMRGNWAWANPNSKLDDFKSEEE